MQENVSQISIVVPCYNEKDTLEASVNRLVQTFAEDPCVALEVIIVDDCSTDGSPAIAEALSEKHDGVVKLVKHAKNAGKGAALRTGFKAVSGEYVGIHDADLEYDPSDLLRLFTPLRDGSADVVYGSRFLTAGTHRVLYFWHAMGNRFITLLSNMFTDLNLSDIETCYKVFRREVIDAIELEEDRFGIEPEITAKIAGARVRIFEMGISYYGRTYEEGKKIGVRDGFRALYCIIRYNAPTAPLAIQALIYLFIGGSAAVFNLFGFALLREFGMSLSLAAGLAFVAAAGVNYLLCVLLLFRRKARWSATTEQAIYWSLVATLGFVDVASTSAFVWAGMGDLAAKASASALGVIFNFAGRKWLVFPEPARGPWRKQNSEAS